MAASDRDQARAAALRAAEARLHPPPSYDTASQPASASAAAASQPAPASAPASLPAASFRPTEKDDREARIKFSRLLDRGIVRDNGYRQTAEAVETLYKIASNILTSDDPKFRSLKATNTMLKNKVLSVKGGHEYLIALGFRTQTVDFTTHYVFAKTLRGVHEMEIGAQVLHERIKSLQDRVDLSSLATTAHRTEEAERRARALREIDADRDLVRDRAERERIGRAERERKEREQKEAQEAEDAEAVVQADEEERRELEGGVWRTGGRGSRRTGAGQAGPAGQAGEEGEEGEGGEEGEDDEDHEDDGLPSYGESRWNGGRRLGG